MWREKDREGVSEMRKPIIGITTSLEEQRKLVVTRHYSDWIQEEGGLPLIIPYISTDLAQQQQIIEEYTKRLDGLLLSGGGDIDPTLFGEEPLPGLGPITPERDQLEVALAQEMLKHNRPILAICRGAQILNIAAGGDMYQDLEREYTGALLQHQQNAPVWHASHHIEIEKKSKLSTILKVEKAKTNSFHHQAIKQPAPYFQSVAFSRDGVIEAIESLQHDYVIGVQWHPECMPASDPISKKLFQSFVTACGRDEKRN